MANDPHKNTVQSADSFGTVGRVITPGNVDLDPVPKTVCMLAAGNITIVPVGNADGETLTFTGLAAGAIVPYRPRRVTAATAQVATVEG